jgi:hypothetical protein
MYITLMIHILRVEFQNWTEGIIFMPSLYRPINKCKKDRPVKTSARKNGIRAKNVCFLKKKIVIILRNF